MKERYSYFFNFERILSWHEIQFCCLFTCSNSLLHNVASFLFFGNDDNLQLEVERFEKHIKQVRKKIIYFNK